MKRLALILFLLSFLSANLQAADTLIFTPSSAVGVSNNTVHYGPHPSRSGTNRVNIGTNTHWVITSTAPATVSFLFATAWASGIESIPSNELLYTNRNFAPTLRLSGPSDALALQATEDMKTWKTLAVIVSSNQPLIVQSTPKQFFRTLTTNTPPLPWMTQQQR